MPIFLLEKNSKKLDQINLNDIPTILEEGSNKSTNLGKEHITEPPYVLSSVLTIPVKIARRLQAIQSRFLWGDSEDRRRYHLVRWEEIKKPLKLGGLGLTSLVKLNLVLFREMVLEVFKRRG